MLSLLLLLLLELLLLLLLEEADGAVEVPSAFRPAPLSLLELPLLLAPKSALPEETDGAGGVPSASLPALFSGSAAGAKRAAGGTGNPASVMSRSDSLFKSTLPPPGLDAPPLLSSSPASDSPSSVIRGSCCGGTGGAEDTCRQVTLRAVIMER